MSVSLTELAVVERRKTVTRRVNWWRTAAGRPLLSVGDRLTLCRKVMGRRPGEPLVRLGDVRVVSIDRVQLDHIDHDECVREGFPEMTPDEFVTMFCATHRGCDRTDLVTRIEWEYLT